MASWKLCCSPTIVLLATLASSPAVSQHRSDPIGKLVRVDTFDRAQHINVGKTKSGKLACYFREQGSSHTLDIGLTADGAFLWLETGDERETTPSPPLRIFAGKQITRSGYVTNEFKVIEAYSEAVDFYVPNAGRGNFVIVAKGNAKAFFDMVARARSEFVVVQSAADRNAVDVVAVYDFNPAAAAALLSCAKARIR